MSEKNELPQGWCWATLGEVCQSDRPISYGVLQPGPDYPGGVPLVRVCDVVDGRIAVDQLKRIAPAISANYVRTVLRGGEVLLTVVGTIGRTAVAPEAVRGANTARAVAVLPISAVIEPKFVELLLRDSRMRAHLTRAAHEVARKTLNLEDVRATRIPLAPLNEQRRIVAKIEELFSDLDAGVAALQRTKAKLKRYRAAVLKAAVEGRLTAEWREKHKATEPASKLLERILAERRKRWEAEQEAKFAATGKTPPKDWREKYVEPSLPENSVLPELPDGWCWASMAQVGSVQLGRQRSPKYHNGPHMRPYLRVANVFEDRIDISDIMEMDFPPDDFETYRLGHGDILLNEGQSMELVGRPAMYRDEVPGACFTNTLVRFRACEGVGPLFALKVFLAYLKNGRFQKVATITVNIAHLGAGRFAEIEFPLPPVEEQQAIIEEVDRHFSMIEAAERGINMSLIRASRLRQSILKRAFEGSLVPQDPHDEPASVLLDRIRATRRATSLERNGEVEDNAGRERSAGKVRQSRRTNRAAPVREP